MITLQELCHYLEQLLLPGEFKDYGPNGLQVEGKSEVVNIYTALSASLETIYAAIAQQADALIVHHGMFWQRDPYEIVGVKKKKLELLLQHNLSLVAYHLPLDAHQEVGNNWRAARDLGLTDLSPFCDFLGVKGQISAISCEQFQQMLEDYYQHQAVCALGRGEKIHSVALISGGAHWKIVDAAREGIDCFVTGSFDEPIWHIAHEEQIDFFALGHAATERVGPQALAEYLSEHLPVNCHFIDIPNPF